MNNLSMLLAACSLLIVCHTPAHITFEGDLSFRDTDVNIDNEGMYFQIDGYTSGISLASAFSNASASELKTVETDTSLSERLIKRVKKIRILADSFNDYQHISIRYRNTDAYIVELDDGSYLFVFDAILDSFRSANPVQMSAAMLLASAVGGCVSTKSGVLALATGHHSLSGISRLFKQPLERAKCRTILKVKESDEAGCSLSLPVMGTVRYLVLQDVRRDD